MNNIRYVTATHIGNWARDGEPVGVDVVELPVLRALEAEGLNITDGHGFMQDIRAIKTADEIALLDHSAALVDGAYDELYRYLRAGIRENACVALVTRY